ncbi:kinase-like protein [Atractiella rhizophila]|nr:kinase-like protein [Atractiella rhizophila]
MAIPKNVTVTTNAAGEEELAFHFAEEPLGIPAAHGLGFPNIKFGDRIGPGGRFEVKRKLGFGGFSSVWLARDKEENKFVAIKALTGHATEFVQKEISMELEALEVLSSPGSNHCLRLLSSFTLPGDDVTGQHICLVTPVYGGTIRDLHRKLPGKNGGFPLPIAKKILLHMLRGLSYIHDMTDLKSTRVAHTDLKHDNIFFTTALSYANIDQLLEDDPPRVSEAEASPGPPGRYIQAALSQPLPLPAFEEWGKPTFLLGDFSHCQIWERKAPTTISTPELRPPEIYLQSSYSETVDIWSFGCMVFDLVIGRSLFRHEPDPEKGLTADGHMLYQMMCILGEEFSGIQLGNSDRAAEFFDINCNLKLKEGFDIINCPLERCISNYKLLPLEEVMRMAKLMRRCLVVDPRARPSAKELLDDPWFNGFE